jgi:hypothetical protein
MFGDRSGDQKKIGVPRACDEPDTEPVEVVKWIVEGVDFQLAAIAGAGVDVTDAQRAAKYGTDVALQAVANAQAFIRLRRWLGDDAERCNLTQYF